MEDIKTVIDDIEYTFKFEITKVDNNTYSYNIYYDDGKIYICEKSSSIFKSIDETLMKNHATSLFIEKMKEKKD